MRTIFEQLVVERAPDGGDLVDFARVDVQDVLVRGFGRGRNIPGIDHT
jgi:hypothetical protein